MYRKLCQGETNTGPYFLGFLFPVESAADLTFCLEPFFFGASSSNSSVTSKSTEEWNNYIYMYMLLSDKIKHESYIKLILKVVPGTGELIGWWQFYQFMKGLLHSNFHPTPVIFWHTTKSSKFTHLLHYWPLPQHREYHYHTPQIP